MESHRKTLPVASVDYAALTRNPSDQQSIVLDYTPSARARSATTTTRVHAMAIAITTVVVTPLALAAGCICPSD